MAARYLGRDDTDQQYKTNGDSSRQRYRLSETVQAGTSDWVILPTGLGDIAITVDPTSTARVEFTQSTVASVLSGSATGTAWDDGDVAALTFKTMANAVTAIRLVATGGAADWTITA